MLVQVKKHGAWSCLSNPRQRQWVERLPAIPELLDTFSSTLVTPLKDNHRSLVVHGQLANRQMVAKQPRDKNRRLWARLLSYIEPSEAAQTLSTLERFHELGIASVQPLFVLEKRTFGVVVDSWLCYEFRDGVKSQEAELSRIIEMLKSIHQAGFCHKDPHLGNFMIDPNNEMFVLDSRGRRRVGNLSDANDFFLLKKINKNLTDFEVSELGHLDTQSIGYKLAALYNTIKSARSAIKARLRKKRPKNNDQ